MSVIRLHDLSLRCSLAFLALASSTLIYSCAGQTRSEDHSKEIAKKSSGAVVKRAELPKKTSIPAPGYHFVKPAHVKGIYWTAWTAGSSRARNKLLQIIDQTELNSVVIDIRDEGILYFKTGIELANEKGVTKVAVAKPVALMKALDEHHVWPIARIACFRDNFMTVNHPDRAIQFANGKLWRDRKGYHWLDPYNKKNWEYIAAIVDFALDLGFPAIQLDYVRFPSEGKAASQVFPAKQEYSKVGAAEDDVIAAFAKYIGERVHARHAIYSVDIFGIISSMKGDEGIGQQLEKVAAPFDVLSPMIYPSHFALGEYGVANPNESPYDIIKKSLKDYKKRLPKTYLCPWLQAFSLHGVQYAAPELRAQIQAEREVGYQSFLLWNAENKYPYLEQALAPKDSAAAAPASVH